MDNLSIQEMAPCPTLNLTISAIADQELSDLLISRLRLAQPTVSLESRLDQWYSYFHSLSKIEPRYTVALERSNLDTICFTWKDSFKPSNKHSHTTIASEKMAVMFNVGAVYSQIGAAENRETDEGLTKAFKAFQSAAGAWLYLIEATGGDESVGFSKECVSTLETMMLAHAQECFFTRAVRAGKSPNSCSRVARQVGLYYEELQRALSTAPLHQQFDKGWPAHVQLKASQFYAESCYHYSLHLHEDGSIGEEIARLQMGLNHLRNTRKSIKCASSSMIKVISRLEKNMNLRLEKAEKENSSIYYMKVPAASSLSELPAYALEIPKPLERLAALANVSENMAPPCLCVGGAIEKKLPDHNPPQN